MLYCSLKSISANGQGEKWRQLALSSLEKRVRAYCCSRSPCRRANSLPSCVPGFPWTPAFTLCYRSAHLAAERSCILSQVHWLGFKTPNFSGPGVSWTHAGSLGEGLTVLWLVLVCPRRAIEGTCRGMEFMEKHSEREASRLAALSKYFCSYAN